MVSSYLRGSQDRVTLLCCYFNKMRNIRGMYIHLTKRKKVFVKINRTSHLMRPTIQRLGKHVSSPVSLGVTTFRWRCQTADSFAHLQIRCPAPPQIRLRTTLRAFEILPSAQITSWQILFSALVLLLSSVLGASPSVNSLNI